MREFPISIGYVQSSFPVALKLINKCIQYECFGLSLVVAPFFLADGSSTRGGPKGHIIIPYLCNLLVEIMLPYLR